MRLALASIIALTACGSPQAGRTSTPSSAAASTTAGSCPTVGSTEVTVPAEASRLLAATNELATVEPNLEHTQIIHALERLADALEVVAPDQTEDILRVRQSAVELERSSASAPIHAELVRAGLTAAAHALQTVQPVASVEPGSIQALRLHEAAGAVANAAAAIESETPLMEQYGYVRVAIRESTRAVYASLGARDPSVRVFTARR